MRPIFFATCAACMLLASATPCALAQETRGNAALISSGHPANAAPASSGARRTLSDDEPYAPLRDESALGDQSWTVTPAQSANSPTQSSRSTARLSDTRPTEADAGDSQPASLPPTQLRSVPQHAPIQQAAAQQAAPLQAAALSTSAAQSSASAVRPASGVYPSSSEPATATSGASHLRSHVAQAQYTSAATGSVQSPRSGQSVLATSDEHRPLKPPTAADPAAEEKRSSGTVQMFVSVISSLLIVIGLLLGAAWCYRKATPSLAGSLPKQALQILGRTPLAPRQQLILVRFGPKLVLMSNLQGEVRAISEIVDPLEVDRICGMCESSQAGSISDSFRTVLHNIGRTG